MCALQSRVGGGGGELAGVGGVGVEACVCMLSELGRESRGARTTILWSYVMCEFSVASSCR